MQPSFAKTRLKVTLNGPKRPCGQVLATMHGHRCLAFAAVTFDSHVTPLLANRPWLAACSPDPPENLLAGHTSTAVDIISDLKNETVHCSRRRLAP